MTSYLGLMFKISMNPGRRISELERQVVLDAKASDALGYEVPAVVHKQVLTYTPQDEIVKKVRTITTEAEIEAAYQAAILSAEQIFAGMRTAPPLQGMNLRVHCFQFEQSGARTYQTVVAHTTTAGKAMNHLPAGMMHHGLPQKKDIDLLSVFTYKDWKDLDDFVKEAAPELYFVAHLEAPPTDDSNQVRLRLELANNVYTPQGPVLYTSGTTGFLEGFDPDTLETTLLDRPGLLDEQRLPALAALWASSEHIEGYLEIGRKGVLDSMSATSPNRARYRIRVVHMKGYDFNVEMRMGDAINGNCFGPLQEFHVNIEQPDVHLKEDGTS